MSEHNSFYAFGSLISDSGSDGEIHIKKFDISFPVNREGRQDAPHGWHWTRWTVTLNRIMQPGQRPFVTFLADWECHSYGRWSGDYTPWEFRLATFQGENLLSEFKLGQSLIGCSTTSKVFKGICPPPEPTVGFPLELFENIDKVRLYGAGNQEAC